MNTSVYIFSKLLKKEDFNYIQEFDDIQIENPNFSIFEYPINIREIWYKFVPEIIRKYKNFAKKYNLKNLSNDLIKDADLEFIPIELISDEQLKTQTFGKLLSEDFKFIKKDELAQNYFRFTKIVRYSAGVISDKEETNIDFYLRSGLIKIDSNTYENILNLDHLNLMLSEESLIKLHNNVKRIIGDPYEFIERVYNKDTKNWKINMENFVDPVYEQAVIHIIRNYHTLPVEYIEGDNVTKAMLTYKTHDTLEFWYEYQGGENDEYFEKYARLNNLHDINDVKLLTAIENEDLWCKYFDVNILEQFAYIELNSNKIATKLSLFKQFMNEKKNPEIFKLSEFVDLVIKLVDEVDENLFLDVCESIDNPKEFILKYKPIYAETYFERLIKRKEINKDNFKQLFSDWGIQPKINTTLAFTWVETYHEEPPLEIYVAPNHNVRGVNLSVVWRRNVNVNTVPMEMTSMKYWEYMVKTQGKKKNPDFTMCYSFFSNTEMNKLIFCKSDIELLEPAKERMFIPIEFAKLKEFLHEDLKTNDICLFSHMTKDDFNKVTGGRDNIDIVVFSDLKNIYRERTSLKEIIEYIKDNIELTFNIECDKLN